jgi:hypothetical protein
MIPKAQTSQLLFFTLTIFNLISGEIYLAVPKIQSGSSLKEAED